MKKFRNLFVALLACFAIVGCGGNGGGGNAYVEGFQDVEALDESLKSIGANKKVYFTTLGQADFTTGEGFVEDLEIEFTSEKVLKAADVEEGSVVIVVIGYTGKGISGNITQASEYERVEEFKDAATANKFDIIALYLSGKQRRGTNTDAFLSSILPVAKVGFVWSDPASANAGNYDGKIPTFSGDTKVYYYSDDVDIGPALEYVMK